MGEINLDNYKKLGDSDTYMVNFPETENHFIEFDVIAVGNGGEQIRRFIKGTVKWDGCSNLEFGDNGFYHFCEYPIHELNYVLNLIWEEAEDRMHIDWNPGNR